MDHKKRAWDGYLRLAAIHGASEPIVVEEHFWSLERLAWADVIPARLRVERLLFEAAQGLTPHTCRSCSGWLASRTQPSPVCRGARFIVNADEYGSEPDTANACGYWNPDYPQGGHP